jgi:hypothetical protein
MTYHLVRVKPFLLCAVVPKPVCCNPPSTIPLAIITMRMVVFVAPMRQCRSSFLEHLRSPSVARYSQMVPGSSDEYLIRPAGAHDAKVVALQRASMFRDMGSVSADESELLRRASEPWLSGKLTNGDYIGWLVEHRGIIVAGGGIFCAGVRARSGGVIGWVDGGTLRISIQNPPIGGAV